MNDLFKILGEMWRFEPINESTFERPMGFWFRVDYADNNNRICIYSYNGGRLFVVESETYQEISFNTLQEAMEYGESLL